MTDPKIRVLWLVKGLAPGGAERLLVSTARVADRERFDFEVAYLMSELSQIRPELAAVDVPAHCLDGNELDLRWVARLRRLLVRGRYDVVHVHSPYLAGFVRMVVTTLPRSCRPALVSTEHNQWSSYAMPTRLLNAATYGLDHHRFVVSSAVRQQVAARHRDRVEVLVQGIVTEDVVQPESTRGAVRRELGISDGEFLLVTVANLRPAKDYPRLLRAVRSLVDAGHPARLVAAGDGPLMPEISQLRDDLGLRGVVDLLGSRPDVYRLLHAADTFVMSSLWEGYPIALMEAMASGCPIVATAVGGVPDAIRPGADEGVLVEGDSAADLADCIAGLIAQPERRRRLSERARLRSAMFDIRRPTSRQQEIYAALAATRRVNATDVIT